MTDVRRAHRLRRAWFRPLANRPASALAGALSLTLGVLGCGDDGAPEPKAPPALGEPQYDRPLAEPERDVCTDRDGDGVYASCEGMLPSAVDCDDQDPTRYPGAEERCDGRDNDCDDTTGDAASPACVLSCEEPEGGCDTLRKVVAGDAHACALTSAGRVLCWSGAGSVQGAGTYVPGIEGADDIDASGGLTCVRKGEQAICWDDKVNIPTAFELSGPTMAVGDDFVCSVADGLLTCFLLSKGAPGDPARVVEQLFVGESTNYMLAAGGILVCVGGDFTQCYALDEGVFIGQFGVDAAVPVSIGEQVCYIAEAPRTLVCETATGSEDVPDVGDAVEVSRGTGIGCTRSAEGKVSCWLGPSAPADARLSHIATGREFGCGITQDGRALCWGAMEGDPLNIYAAYESGPLLNAGGEPLGACDNPGDLAALWARPILDVAAACDCQSFEGEDCLPDCFRDRDYVSDGCAGCFATWQSCDEDDGTCRSSWHTCAGFSAETYATGDVANGDQP